ncbi:MAG: rRNA maturation RNase YbeY [Pseudomonadota bacterium]|jgi:probable rRNA maturation factor
MARLPTAGVASRADEEGPAGAMRAPEPATLSLSLQMPDARHRAQLPRHRVRRWLRAALQAPAEITVRIVDEVEGRALNRDFRNRDYATNVLTFDYAREPVVCADLVLCAPVVEREAEQAGRSIEAHYAHLLIHGALHAQGLDHDTDARAQEMEGLESRLMIALGLPDPWDDGQATGARLPPHPPEAPPAAQAARRRRAASSAK